MTQQIINIGTAANDGTGEPIRTAFEKCNANFTELFGNLSDAQIAAYLAGLPTTDPGDGSLYYDGAALKRSFAESLFIDFKTNKALAATKGPTPTFSRASVGRFLNASGLFAEAAIDAPRFHHFWVDGLAVSGGLLLEPARTNLFLHSADITGGAWVINNLTAGANDAVAPDGTTTATNLTESIDGSATFHRIYQSVTVAAASIYTSSIFYKPSARSKIRAIAVGNFFDHDITFDVHAESFSTAYPNATGRIEKLPNGWYRLSVQDTSVNAGSALCQWWTVNDAGGNNYQATGQVAGWVWCPQMELGRSASTPILATGTQVTRAADVCVIDGADFAAIDTTAGMLVVETAHAAAVRDVTFASINDGSANNAVTLGRAAGGDFAANVVSGGANSFAGLIPKVFTDNEFVRSGVSFAATNTLAAIKGESTAADTNSTMPAARTKLELGPIGGCLASVQLFGTQQTNNAFVALTGQQSAIAPDVLAVAHITKIICDGNSLTAPSAIDYPDQMEILLAAKIPAVEITNVGVGGQNTVDMNADRAAQVHPLIVSGQTIVIPWEISNHIYSLGATARQAVDELWIYCDAVRALGAKVVIATPTPRSNAGTPADFETKRQAACTLMRNEWRAHGDAFVDIALDARIGVAGAEADTTYYAGDLVHLNATGYGVVAELMTVGVLIAANADTYSDYAALSLSPAKAEMYRVSVSGFTLYADSAPGARIRFNCTYPEINLQFAAGNPQTGAFSRVGLVFVNGVRYSSFLIPTVVGQTVDVHVAGSGDRLIEVVLPISSHADFLGVVRYGAGAITKPIARPTKTIAVCGDSITQGFSASDISKSWAYLLAGLQNAQLINHGFGSARADNLATDNVGQYQADAIIYCIGYNDFSSQQPLATFKANVQTWLDAVRAVQPTTKVYLGGPFWTANTNTLTPANYRTQISDLVTAEADANTVYVNTLAATTNNLTHHPDGIHPNDLGHAEIAAFLNTLLG